MDTPVHKRIGLSTQQYKDDNIIKPHERVFVEKFTSMGYCITWILRSSRKTSNGLGYLPTNDFLWRNYEWELKKPKIKKYNNIFNMIKKGVKKGKKNYLIDLGETQLTERLIQNLSTYNIRNPKKKITRLYILDKENLFKILLE